MAASPELKVAIRLVKNLMAKEVASVPEMRANIAESMSEFNRVADDITIEPVDSGGIKAEWIAAPNVASDRVLVFFHGGSYVVCSAKTHRDIAARLSRAAGARVLNVDYRLAPEHPFPAALDDARSVYQWLLAMNFTPSKIVLAGDSAGGGLTLATLVAIRDESTPQPAAAVCMSPWVDLECSGESMVSKASVDPFVSQEPQRMLASLYLNGANSQHPLASPLHANLGGLCPLLIQVGSSETLLDDATRLEVKAKEAGVDVTLQIWDEMIHGWQVFASFLPEGQQAIEAAGRFAKEAFSE